MAKSRFWQTHDQFFSQAQGLRSVFDEKFANPRDGHNGRFVWDYWHIEDQYTLHRTPAEHYFPKELYEPFLLQLIEFGRRHYGCHNVSSPWLSYYIDGCRQDLHADIPHGPLAFVFSLTPWKKRKFRGGETFLLKPETLNYWQTPRRGSGLEAGHLIHRIAPEMNRLTVFDPRLPHGVMPVEGVKDPREGRLVIHGWFVRPEPYFEGPISQKVVASALEEIHGGIEGLLAEGDPMSGHFVIRINLKPGQKPTTEIPCNTLVNLNEPLAPVTTFARAMSQLALSMAWPTVRTPAHVTIPFLFE